MAYQWTLNYPGELTVANELFEADFGNNPVKVHFPQCETRTWTEWDLKHQPHEINQAYRNFEREYIRYESIDAIPDSAISTSPALFTLPGGKVRVAITEANVYDYPGLYLQRPEVRRYAAIGRLSRKRCSTAIQSTASSSIPLTL